MNNNWVEMLEQTTWRAYEGTRNLAGGTKVVNKPIKDEDSNDDGTKVQLCDEPACGFDLDEDNDEVWKHGNNEDYQMFIDEDESSGFQHSTSKPKPNKKKKSTISWKEFLDLKGKIDQILISISTV